MTSTLYDRAALIMLALALACSACGDDDSEPPVDDRPDGSMDASIDGSDPQDAGDRDGDAPDSSMKPDGASDRDSSVDPDAGDASMCELVEEPYFSNFETPFNAVRVPLDVFCSDDRCDPLDVFAERFDCTELPDDASIADLELAEDAGSGCCFNWWIRTEGCGNVQYRAYMTWPRIFNFDAATGAPIGYGRQDDIDYDFGGCTHYAFVAGEILHDCPNATESICSR